MKKSRFTIDSDTKVLLKQIGIGLGVISVVGLLITAVWYGTRVESQTITEVEVSGGQTIKLSRIEKIVQDTLEGSYVGLVPRRFAWWYPESEIVERVSRAPRIYDVSVKKESGTKLFLSFKEYSPAALWCESVESNVCVFVDSQAYSFAEAPHLSGGSFLRFIKIDKEVKVGETFLDLESFDSLQLLTELLANEGIYVSHIELDTVGDAFLGLAGGGELKVLVSEDPVQTVDNLITILSSEDFSHIKPGNFQYIDLRFGEKIFIKEKETVPEDETAIDGEAIVEDEVVDSEQ